MSKNTFEISIFNRFIKRLFDIVFSFLGLVATWWIILMVYLIILFKYRESGFYIQTRVGLNEKEFKIIKLKSMRNIMGYETTVTIEDDPRITPVGKFIRKTKIDELPQLINVLKGDMSFVGPRPDVKDVIYSLNDFERKIYTSIRPGITGPATLKYRNEEELLNLVKNPEQYSKEVIFRDKYEINKKYIKNYSFKKDIEYILQTVFTNSETVKV